MAITGVTIQLLNKAQTGTDAFNRPIYEETPESVENVLVGQPSSEEIKSTLELTGKKAVYILAIPKGDAHKWENQRVVLPEPFAGTYQVIGFPTAGIEANIPLSWNKKVMVERYG